MELNALCLDKSGKLETAEQEDKKAKELSKRNSGSQSLWKESCRMAESQLLRKCKRKQERAYREEPERGRALRTNTNRT